MSIKRVEKIILKLFRNEPFHNLYQYYERPFPQYSLHKGGTCSVKTVSAWLKMQALKPDNITVQLHQGMVHFNQQSFDHRLLKITLRDKVYFADVGNAWPTLRLFPAHKAIKFNCYGFFFYSKLCKNHLKIYQRRDGRSSYYLTIPFSCLSEPHIRGQIKKVFSQLRAPNKELRFAQIIDQQFLFLRGKQLHIYTDGCRKQIDLAHQPISKILQTHFNFDLEKFLSYE